ncbi:nuclear transport factor 2 family protein [Arthrobacter sp. SX1312]|uniref:nuclear transport factor 2 family protein n=1 Tax=Arthrobacter sp. SX1312 TaxID=2058896 RepID=UPI000CE4D654|nr:nuclear transport factor 2 family protein [Arthrobacter sp. SX1312]
MDDLHGRFPGYDARMTDFLEQPEWHNAPMQPVPITRPAAQKWLDAYVAAWKSYDEGAISDLWSEGAVWHYPFQTRASGRDRIVAEWMSERDDFVGESFDAKYHPVAIEGVRVVAHGRTVFYQPESDRVVTAYDNIWFLRFDDSGRCTEFHEWYAGRPEDEPDRAVPNDRAHEDR